MPNWCFNKIAFVSKDRSKVEKIRNIIVEGKKHPKTANDWTDWMLCFPDGSEELFNIRSLLPKNEQQSRLKISKVNKIEYQKNVQFSVELESVSEIKPTVLTTIFTKLYPKGTNLVVNDYSLVNAILHLTNLSEEHQDQIVGNARGYILDIGEVRPFFDEYFFELTCDSAWSPADSFEEAIKSYDGVDVSRSSEECGMEIYDIHDNHGIYDYEYAIDTDIPEFDGCDCYFNTASDVIELAKEVLKDKYDFSNVKSIDDLEELNDDDHFFAVRHFTRS